MKVVHLINSLGFGGAERQLALLSAELAGFDVEQLIVPLVGVQEGVEMPRGVRVAQPTQGYLSVLSAFLRTWREVNQTRSCTIVAWMYHAWILGLCIKLIFPFRVKIFLYCRHGDIQSLKRSTRVIAVTSLWIGRMVGAHIVFNSLDARERHLLHAGKNRSSVVPNGVRLPRVLPNLERRTIRTVAFLGRNHHDKGADVLPGIVCEVLTAVPDVRFVVAGPGMLAIRPDFEAALTQAGCEISRLQVFGSIRDVGQFLSEVDVLVIPSRNESFPNVLVEALAAGVLVACTSVGDMPEILGDVVETADDPRGVAAIAARLSVLPVSEIERMRSTLFSSVMDRYEISRIAGMHLRLWQKDRGAQ